jgi:hypothetical protein
MSSFEVKFKNKIVCGMQKGARVMLVQIDENSAILTPFGSLIRISNPAKVSSGNSRRALTASTASGNRAVKSLPWRVNGRTPPPSRRA